MKKLVVIAVLFALLAGAIFAQELKFDGYFNSGLGVVNVGDNDAVVKPFGVDSEQNGFRFRLNGSYQNEAKNAGVRFRLQSQGNLTTSGYLSLPYIYGWVSFLDNIINLTGGIVDDGTYATGDWWIADDAGEGLGLLLKVTPISGLSLGAGAYVISQQSGSSNNILTVNSALPNFGSVTPLLEDAKYVFGGSYTMADVFRLDVSFRTKNEAGWDTATPPPAANAGRQESSALYADLRILAVKNLTAVVAASLDNLHDFSKSGETVVSETFAYKISDEFNAGLDMAQFFYSDTGKDPGFLFHAWGAYSLNSIVPRLDLTYFLGGQSNTSQQYHRKGYAIKNDDYSVFGIRPSVKINLDSRTFLEIGDVINLDIDKNKGYDGKDLQFTNVFYLDFKWSF